jgi:PAN domain-containing protein
MQTHRAYSVSAEVRRLWAWGMREHLSAKAKYVASTLVLFWLGVASARGLMAADGHFEIFADKDSSGNDIKVLQGGSLKQCMSECLSETACQGFTYNLQKHVCFLKQELGSTLSDFRGAVTGRKLTSIEGQPSSSQADYEGTWCHESGGLDQRPITFSADTILAVDLKCELRRITKIRKAEWKADASCADESML